MHGSRLQTEQSHVLYRHGLQVTLLAIINVDIQQKFCLTRYEPDFVDALHKLKSFVRFGYLSVDPRLFALCGVPDGLLRV